MPATAERSNGLVKVDRRNFRLRFGIRAIEQEDRNFLDISTG